MSSLKYFVSATEKDKALYVRSICQWLDVGGKTVLKSRLAFGWSAGQMMMHVLREEVQGKKGRSLGGWNPLRPYLLEMLIFRLHRQ